VHTYGQLSRVAVVTRDMYLRDIKQKVRIVVIESNREPVILVSTDMTLSSAEIIEIYSSRFSIEIAIRDLKQHFGFGDYQCTTNALQRNLYSDLFSFPVYLCVYGV